MGDLLEKSDCTLSRSSPFSYTCKACNRCCHNKGIAVSPYESLRLARRLGVTTTVFLERFTEHSGTILKTLEEADGACVFLGPQGCTVHPDRPLVCRIYPLGLFTDADGTEHIGQIEPEEGSEGVTSRTGTVADYFEAQGLLPFLAMARRYREVFDLMVDKLAEEDALELDQQLDIREEIQAESTASIAHTILDIDAAIARHCAAHHAPPPATLEGTVDLHLSLIRTELETVFA
jgi:Fe-S-cluster containining protein